MNAIPPTCRKCGTLLPAPVPGAGKPRTCCFDCQPVRRLPVARTGELCGGKRSLLCPRVACDHNIAHLGPGEHLRRERALVCSIVAAVELGPMRLDDVGRLMGVTRECVRQAEEKALAKLHGRVQDLREYVE